MRGPYQKVLQRWIYEACWLNYQEYMADLITVEMSSRMSYCAGYAYVERQIIRICKNQWKRMTSKERKQLIIHEVCHCLCPANVIHGQLWKDKMAACGYKNANRFQEVEYMK